MSRTVILDFWRADSSLFMRLKVDRVPWEEVLKGHKGCASFEKQILKVQK